MVLNFLGAFKPIVVVIIWFFIITTWVLAILATILIPFAFVWAVPLMFILFPITIFSIGGLYIVNKKAKTCSKMDGKMTCDL